MEKSLPVLRATEIINGVDYLEKAVLMVILCLLGEGNNINYLWLDDGTREKAIAFCKEGISAAKKIDQCYYSVAIPVKSDICNLEDVE